MGGEGSIMQMINSLKNNKAMRGSKEPLRDGYFPKSKTELDFVKKSDEELQEIRQKIRLKTKAEQRKVIIISVVMCVIVLITFYFLFRNFSVNTDLFFHQYHRKN